MVTISGIFETVEEAQRAVQELTEHGWTRENISVITSQSPAPHLHSPSLTMKDAEKGAAIGGLAGLFIGLSELAIPGVGLVLVGGWLVTTLLGAGIGAAVGSLTGALVEAGIGHEQAGRLAESVQQGRTLVMVKSKPDQVRETVTLLKQRHAVSIEEHTEP